MIELKKERQELLELLTKEAYVKGKVILSSGKESDYYIDARRVTLTAKKITPRETDEYGEVAWDAVLTNQNDEIVATYDVLTLVEK